MSVCILGAIYDTPSRLRQLTLPWCLRWINRRPLPHPLPTPKPMQQPPSQSICASPASHCPSHPLLSPSTHSAISLGCHGETQFSAFKSYSNKHPCGCVQIIFNQSALGWCGIFTHQDCLGISDTKGRVRASDKRLLDHCAVRHENARRNAHDKQEEACVGGRRTNVEL
jgi:hypothetical protein